MDEPSGAQSVPGKQGSERGLTAGRARVPNWEAFRGARGYAAPPDRQSILVSIAQDENSVQADPHHQTAQHRKDVVNEHLAKQMFGQEGKGEKQNAVG